jgi:hypothetical protein
MATPFEAQKQFATPRIVLSPLVSDGKASKQKHNTPLSCWLIHMVKMAGDIRIGQLMGDLGSESQPKASFIRQ